LPAAISVESSCCQFFSGSAVGVKAVGYVLGTNFHVVKGHSLFGTHIAL
jgi:hypothetical protein